MTMQPREHTVTCRRCLSNQTWNIGAVCFDCLTPEDDPALYRLMKHDYGEV
jgi:hypothetical protein